MISKPLRTLLDVAALGAVAWLWIVVYESFTRTGVWAIVAREVGGVTTMPAQAAVIAACVLMGWLVLAGSVWLIWRLLLRRRDDTTQA